MQWIAVTGLRRYDESALAETIAYRWLATVSAVYADTGKLLEKYNVVELTPAAASTRCRTASAGPTASRWACSASIPPSSCRVKRGNPRPLSRAIIGNPPLKRMKLGSSGPSPDVPGSRR